MARRHSIAVSLVPILMSLQPLGAWASDLSPQLEKKNMLEKAVHLQVTPRGMKYFDAKLSDILGNLGVKLDEGYFPAMQYTFDKDIKISDYAATNPEAVQIYNQVRDLLTQWLVGFSLKDHRPAIEIGESGYIAEFSRFGLVTDEKIMQALNKRDGAVLAIELEIKKLTLSTNSVLAWDVNNQFLGKAGFEKVSLSAGSKQTPLKIRLPFYIRANNIGGLEFEALDIESNIDRIEMSLQYKKLLVPTFAVEINGQKFYLNNAELEKTFSAQAPAILAMIRDNIGTLAKTQLPAMLNEKAKEFLGGSLKQVQDMIPPGQEDGDRRPPFKWGLILRDINLKNSLNIDLNAYVEDPINTRSTPLRTNGSKGVVSFNQLDPSKYDIGLSLDRSLINRILQLSYERKNFEKIEQSNGSVLKLMAAPTMDYVKSPAGEVIKAQETFMKLRVSVENKPKSMFLKNTIVVDFDIIAKVRQLSDKTGMQLVLHSIDVDSMYLDDKYISLAGALFKGKVREGVKDELRTQSAGWKKTEEVIPGSLPLPPEILGLKLDINKVTFDPNGHLVMYLDYAK